MPLRLAELSDDELMRLFVALTRWTDHYAGLVATADVEERSANFLLEKVKSQALVRAWGGKDERVTIAKAEVATNADVLDFERHYESAHTKRRAAQVHFEAAERNASLVSRELTRRVGKKESNERRADRWSS